MKYYTNLSDELLIQYFLNGDPRAMATLVELYKDRVYASVYRIVQDKYQAEDIFQAVFIKVINHMIAGKTIEEGKFLCWTMHIAQGLCIERTRQPIQSLTINDQPMPAGFSLNKFTEPAMLVSANTFDNHSKLRNMIDMLPVQQREVIVLNHYSGISFKEIAELMKCSITSALETMRFGLQNLGKLMIEKEVCC